MVVGIIAIVVGETVIAVGKSEIVFDVLHVVFVDGVVVIRVLLVVVRPQTKKQFSLLYNILEAIIRTFQRKYFLK